jgi:hypothetical protein
VPARYSALSTPKLVERHAEPLVGMGKNLNFECASMSEEIYRPRTSFLRVFAGHAFNGGWLPLSFAISATNSSIRFSIA